MKKMIIIAALALMLTGCAQSPSVSFNGFETTLSSETSASEVTTSDSLETEPTESTLDDTADTVSNETQSPAVTTAPAATTAKPKTTTAPPATTTTPKKTTQATTRITLPVTTTPAPVVTTQATTASVPSSSSATFQQQVVDLVNAERAKAGLNPVTVSLEVQNAAQVRASEIITSFSHTRPNGTSCFTALDEQGVRYTASGENIAGGQATPQAVMDGWMNSSGHRANILNANFTHIGVGYIEGGNYRTNWVQMFTRM